MVSPLSPPGTGAWGGDPHKGSPVSSLIPSSAVNELKASRMRLLHHLMSWNSLRGRGDGTGEGWEPGTPQARSPRSVCRVSLGVRARGEGFLIMEAPCAWRVGRADCAASTRPLHTGLSGVLSSPLEHSPDQPVKPSPASCCPAGLLLLHLSGHQGLAHPPATRLFPPLPPLPP